MPGRGRSDRRQRQLAGGGAGPGAGGRARHLLVRRRVHDGGGRSEPYRLPERRDAERYPRIAGHTMQRRYVLLTKCELR